MTVTLGSSSGNRSVSAVAFSQGGANTAAVHGYDGSASGNQAFLQPPPTDPGDPGPQFPSFSIDVIGLNPQSIAMPVGTTVRVQVTLQLRQYTPPGAYPITAGWGGNDGGGVVGESDGPTVTFTEGGPTTLTTYTDITALAPTNGTFQKNFIGTGHDAAGYQKLGNNLLLNCNFY